MAQLTNAELSNTQQHPIGLYLKVWALLFILSTFSYMVDYLHVEGYLRWLLIITFMLLKAGLILSIFMHIMWERQTLKVAILLPPLAILVFMGLMYIEGDYISATRLIFF